MKNECLNDVGFGDEIHGPVWKVHDSLVSGQQPPTIHHGSILDRMRNYL